MEANAVLQQRHTSDRRTSVTSSLVTVEKRSSSNRPVCLSTEEDQLKFEQTTLALRNIYRESNIYRATFHLQNHHHSQTEEAAGEPSNSHLKKNLHCSQCDYQTLDCKSLNFHILTQNPLMMKPSKNESSIKNKSKGCNLNRCQHCDFTTPHKHGLRKHTEHHLNSFVLQCPKCSYSVDHPTHLTCHIKYHHLGGLKQNASADNEDKKKRRQFKVASSKKKVLARFQCELCDYKTEGEKLFNEHLKFHTNALVHQCNRCSYSVNTAHRLASHLKNHHSVLEQVGSDSPLLPSVEDDDFTDQESTKNRKRMNSSHGNMESSTNEERNGDVLDCLFNSNGVTRYPKRVKLHQGNVESNTVQEKVSDVECLFKCKRCNFYTNNYTKLNSHKKCHESNLKLKCPLCSFSSNLNSVVTFHVNNHHGDDSKLTSSTAAAKVAISTNTAIDDLIPRIEPLKPREFDEEETSCREQLNQLEEAVQSDRQSLEDSSNKLMELEEKMKSVRSRIEIIKENVLIAGEEVKDALLHLVEFGKQKMKTLKRKTEAEFELRVQQCKALVLNLIEPDAVEEDHQESLVLVQKNVKDLEIELGEIVKKLSVLEKEEEALTEDLECAEEFPTIGASRWLSIMQMELNELASVWKEEVKSLNQMVDSSKERIQAYNQLEERLLKIDFMRKMDHLSEKKPSLMLSLSQIQLVDNYADGFVDGRPTTLTNKSSFMYSVGLLPV